MTSMLQEIWMMKIEVNEEEVEMLLRLLMRAKILAEMAQTPNMANMAAIDTLAMKLKVARKR